MEDPLVATLVVVGSMALIVLTMLAISTYNDKKRLNQYYNTPEGKLLDMVLSLPINQIKRVGCNTTLGCIEPDSYYHLNAYYDKNIMLQYCSAGCKSIMVYDEDNYISLSSYGRKRIREKLKAEEFQQFENKIVNKLLQD